MIYFLQRKDGNVKIGYTRGQVNGRKAELERRYGSLILLGLHEGGLEVERHLHWRFRQFRLDGEFFIYSDELADYVATNAINSRPFNSPIHLPQCPVDRSQPAYLSLRLRELMDLIGVTQWDVAAATGISQGIISRYMRNKVDSFDGSALDKLCAYFKCGINDLLALRN